MLYRSRLVFAFLLVSFSITGQLYAAPVEMPAERVKSEADLDSYARAALEADQSLGKLSFTENSVEVIYKERGSFLALVPLTYTVKAVAYADGRIELIYPWYSFLTLDNRDELTTELTIAVDNALREKAVGSVRGAGEPEHPVLSASERAVVASKMHAILKARLEGEGE